MTVNDLSANRPLAALCERNVAASAIGYQVFRSKAISAMNLLNEDRVIEKQQSQRQAKQIPGDLNPKQIS